MPNPAYVFGHAQIDSLYAQVSGEVIRGVTLSGGLRQDDHSTFGQHTVGQAALAWSLNDGATEAEPHCDAKGFSEANPENDSEAYPKEKC